MIFISINNEDFGIKPNFFILGVTRLIFLINLLAIMTWWITKNRRFCSDSIHLMFFLLLIDRFYRLSGAQEKMIVLSSRLDCFGRKRLFFLFYLFSDKLKIEFSSILIWFGSFRPFRRINTKGRITRDLSWAIALWIDCRWLSKRPIFYLIIHGYILLFPIQFFFRFVEHRQTARNLPNALRVKFLNFKGT